MAKETPRKPKPAGEEKPESAPRRENSGKASDGASQFLKDKRKRARIPGKSFEPVPRERRQRDEGNRETRDEKPRRRDDSGEREKRSFNPNFSSDNKPLFKERDKREEGRREWNDKKGGRPGSGNDNKWNRRDSDQPREQRSDDRKGGRNSGERDQRNHNSGERGNRFGKSSDDKRGSYRDSARQGKDDRKPFGKKPSNKKPYSDKPAQKDFGDNYPRFPAPKVEKEMRLNRYIAMSGVSSRREADEFISSGQVSVNGVVVTELGTKIKPGDEIRFNDKVIKGEKKVYIVMNKPKGYVTTVEDPHADKTVMDLIKNMVTERVYPVGRLDKNSLGVLLITNDGDLTTRLTHPTYSKKKIYQVTLDRPLTRSDMEQIAAGITLEDGEIHADEISYVKDSKREVGIEIHSGRNRIVRRIFEHLGYKVTKLDRVYFAGLTKKNLKRGAWRFLSPREVDTLMSGKYE